MKKNIIKLVFMIIICGLGIWIFSNASNAAYLSIKPSTTSATPGQTVSLTISSDCVGRVNLTASNGSLSSNRVWVEGSATATVTVGSSGTTVITASPDDGKMATSEGKDVPVSASSASISINTSSTTTNNGAVANNSGTTNQEANKKSSNANLSNLGIRPNDFTGFKAGITSYNVTVPLNVETIEVYATAQDSKSKISGTGTKQLQEGQNAISVVVTAEDGTSKTYTINVTRGGEEVDETKGLATLKIGELELTPEFKTDVYEYSVKYVGTETSLDISAIATDENYIVDITGNENLQEGENIITILVSDADGNNVATYQIKVNKSLTDEVITQTEEDKNQQQNIIIIGIIIAVIIAIIIFIIIKRKRNDKLEEEYTVPFSGLYNNDDEDKSEDSDKNIKIEEETLEDNYEYEENDRKTLKEQFLDNYNSNNNEYEDWTQDEPKRRKHKGKRFK